MVTSNAGQPRGILNLKAGQNKFRLSRRLPSPDLSYFVQHFWIVSWDLREQEPYRAETLPHPSVVMVFERSRSRIVGVVRGKFTRLLQGKGLVFGVKFRPGAFYPFVKTPVSKFTDRVVSLADLFGDCRAVETAILSEEADSRRIKIAEAFLRDRLPEPDPTIELINRVLDTIIADREMTKVDEIVSRFNMSKRTLQRLFNQYVGVAPKWVIQRYRLHDVTEKLAACETVDWPKLALDLGYFDQAHFIKDFKSIVGLTPTDYAREIGLRH